MPRQTLTRRVESLEEKVEPLVTLPERLTALEVTMREGFESLRAEMRAGDEALRADMRAGDEALRADVRAGDEETRLLMRVLHEDLIERIARLGESNGPRRRRKT